MSRAARRYGLILALGAVFGCAEVAAEPPSAPTHLRVCDAVNPVGIGDTPYFGWYVNDADANEIQTAYRIVVASSLNTLNADAADIWDTGAVKSRLQNHVAYAGAGLESDRCYFWKVQTWDRDGHAGAWSEPASFTVGLLDHAGWAGANWIRRETSDADDYTYYRRMVELPEKGIERATVYISGTHKYALYVNGDLVGKGPAYHYPQYQYYNAYDITSLLKSGESNLFAIFNHWFGGGQGRPASERGVIMKTIVHFADGTTAAIGTDGSWRQSRAEAWDANPPHRNRGEGVGYIEKIDARKLQPNWNAPSFDDSEWAYATVIGSHPTAPWTGTLTPDLTRIEEDEITPASITARKGGGYLIDLGKVYAGVPRIRFSGGSAGETVQMLGGYAVEEDDAIDTAQNQSTDMRYYAVLSGEDFVYEPVEYLGMRYFEIENAPMPVTKENFSFVVRHSVMDVSASSFESPDDTLNAVWALMKHSLLTCAQEEFVDTPTREKGGFLGDVVIQSTVAMPVMNERLLTQRALHEYLQSMEQHWPGLGRLNAVYPNNDGARDIPDFTQSYPVWVWNYYMETGDLGFLTANYDRLKSITEYVYRHLDEESGLICNLSGGSGPYQYGIVDWPATMRFGYDMTAMRTVINGWAYADFDVVSKMAGVLGKSADEDLYRRRAAALKQAVNSKLRKNSGVYVDGLNSSGSKSSHVSQHANMLPLALGIVPEAARAKVLDVVKAQEMSVGMVTLPWLIRAIGEADEGEHLIRLFTDPDWNGWAQCLKRGATCTWEAWDADTTGNSQSHAWGASGLEGYVRYILGIRPLEPQYEKVLIKPLDFGGRLGSAGGNILTDRGSVSVSWKSSSSMYGMQLELPVNMTARVAVPKGRSPDPVVHVDGKPMRGTVEGNYVVVDGIGSGHHTIIYKQ